MFLYEKKLQYPVDIKKKDLKMAKYLMSQYGGPDSELAACLRYLNQRYTMPDDKGKALLTDIATEEINHLEMIGTMIFQLMKGATIEEIKNAGVELEYEVGTMIEIPRAALLADEIAEEAEFFSFGTNDLTQMTFGFSRDDAGKFLDAYYQNKIYESDPFARLDQNGVGKLVEMAAKLGRQTRPDLHLGICGEHGGEPSSIEFCNKVGLDYVSCSPYRVPIARLAAAQAAIKSRGQSK